MSPLTFLLFPFVVAGFLLGTITAQFRDGFATAIRLHARLKEGEP
jgi:hypothetical protein